MVLKQNPLALKSGDIVVRNSVPPKGDDYISIEIEIPVKHRLRDIYIVNTETDRKGLKARLEKTWRKYLKRYRPLNIPICCEYCDHVGEAQWHCQNSKSTHHGLNVHAFSICSKWCPNQGLLIYLSRAWWKKEREKWDATSIVPS